MNETEFEIELEEAIKDIKEANQVGFFWYKFPLRELSPTEELLESLGVPEI